MVSDCPLALAAFISLMQSQLWLSIWAFKPLPTLIVATAIRFGGGGLRACRSRTLGQGYTLWIEGAERGGRESLWQSYSCEVSSEGMGGREESTPSIHAIHPRWCPELLHFSAWRKQEVLTHRLWAQTFCIHTPNPLLQLFPVTLPIL